MKYDNKFYNKKLQPNANRLRRNMTKAEACLWKYCLKARKLNGLQFRRQRPIGYYIADFINLDNKLIIEVDGITHHDEKQLIYDKQRESYLENLGYRVIRFQDNQILSNIEGVRLEILKVLEEKLVHPLNPPPAGDIG